ncbi:MAG: (Fe-S)-binding protein, partial [Deltaproteobacteria bacterium]|nr:(Fe-S)-binding protein [Deltaproteobacteria bacterium]
DAIVTDCATCGAAFKKEIPNLLEELGHDPEKAKRVAGKVRDVSQVVCEFMDRIEIVEHAKGEPVKITYHDPCHLVRGMGVASEPRRILRSLPAVSFGEMDGPAECCGGGGAYQFENVTLSAEITSRKRENIQATGARIVATGCPGCRMTLAGNLRDPSVQVLHTIQVLAGKLRQRTNRSARSFADYRK